MSEVRHNLSRRRRATKSLSNNDASGISPFQRGIQHERSRIEEIAENIIVENGCSCHFDEWRGAYSNTCELHELLECIAENDPAPPVILSPIEGKANNNNSSRRFRFKINNGDSE